MTCFELAQSTPFETKATMGIRILVVEDDQEMRELILEHLAAEPAFEVIATTADGEEAVALAQQERPEIVLMDLSLPGLNGLEATKLIRKSCPGTAVIILSNYELEDLRDRIREDSETMQAFLNKREISGRLCRVIHSLAKGELSRSS